MTDKAIEAAAMALAPEMEGGREFDKMPIDRTQLREWARKAMCGFNDATQEDAKEAARAVLEAIIAALSALPAVGEWLDIDEETPANQTLILGWRDWRDGKWCTEMGPYQTGHRVGAYSSVSCHGSATHYLPLSILPAPPIE